MISKKLQRARDFEKKYIPYYTYIYSKFHVTGGLAGSMIPMDLHPITENIICFINIIPMM